MASRRFARPMLLFALLVSPTPAFAQDDTATLKRQTQQLVDAISRGDSGVWDLYLDPDVRYVDETGSVMTKKQMVDGTRPLPAGVSGTIHITDFDAVVHDDVAVATYIDDESETFHGHALHCRYRTTDSWRKTSDGWRLIAAQVLALREDPPSVSLPVAQRDAYRGIYALAPGIVYEIRAVGDGLQGQQSGRMTETLLAEAPDVLFVPGKPRYRYVFLRDAAGKITGFAERREAWDLVWTREPPKGARGT
jgi:ketosteroid isomerase-like protein